MDTSSWVHQIRKNGDAVVRSRVNSLPATGQAAWCAMVRLELWSGACGTHDRKLLRDYEAAITDLPITAEVWATARQLASSYRAAGITAHATDLLIAACTRYHGATMEKVDEDFTQILST